MKSKLLKTRLHPDGKQWPDELVLDVTKEFPLDVHGVRSDSFGVLYIRHDVANVYASNPSAGSGVWPCEHVKLHNFGIHQRWGFENKEDQSWIDWPVREITDFWTCCPICGAKRPPTQK